MGAFHTAQFSIGAMGVFSWPTFVDPVSNDASGMVIAIVVSLVATVAGFILTFLTYSDEPAKKKA